MYYDPEGPLRPATAPPPPFRVDYITGGDGDMGCVQGAISIPLAQAYWCDGCSHLLSKADLQEDVDSYYCPNCLENMPSSEAMLYCMRCAKCWECPVCFGTAVTCHGAENCFYISCGSCHWNTRGQIEASSPEQLVPKVINLERDTHVRLKTALLNEAFRDRAVEQHREKENAQRARRRSSFARSSFAVGVLGGLNKGRISSAINAFASMGRSTTGGPGGAFEIDENGDQVQGPQWRMDDLEAKLNEQLQIMKDIRAPARLAFEERKKEQEEQQKGEGGEGGAGGKSGLLAPGKPPAARGSIASFSSHMSTSLGGKKEQVPDPQVLQGLTVVELLKAHVEGLERPCSGGHGGQNGKLPKMPPPLERLQKSIDEDGNQIGSITTLHQRLPLVAYGYQDLVPSLAADQVETTPMRTAHEPGQNKQDASSHVGGIRQASAQLDAPLWHNNMWALAPIRKPLLTKRSRRCRLMIAASAKADPNAPRRQCKAIVIKPQINPCSIPPFQKENVALKFVPRCYPWGWRGDSGTGEGGQPKMTKIAASSAAAALAAVRGKEARPTLKPGEAAEVVFVIVNPQQTELEVTLDPTFGNKSTRTGSDFDPEVSSAASYFAEQNVEVQTQPFTTTLMKFDAVAETEETLAPADQKRLDELKAGDNKDVIVDRKLHKTLIRIRVKADAGEGESAGSWVFYGLFSYMYEDTNKKKHQVRLVMRFGAEGSNVAAPPPGVLVAKFPEKAKAIKEARENEWKAAQEKANPAVAPAAPSPQPNGTTSEGADPGAPVVSVEPPASGAEATPQPNGASEGAPKEATSESPAAGAEATPQPNGATSEGATPAPAEAPAAEPPAKAEAAATGAPESPPPSGAAEGAAAPAAPAAEPPAAA
mmetsp:Transcript_16921/g.36416  ORF Transcript_16921/g.36416 Transcript_16921/m.36416 type:complete len:878 (-) Transcript_16921:61-2694(-)